MKHLKILLLCLAALLCFSNARADHDPLHVQNPGPVPKPVSEKIVVLELFTTAGCSNCPPADEIMNKVAREYEGNVIALGCHVTYFDQSVRKDPLSIPECDKRHESYRDKGVIKNLYVPQIIINGVFDSKGNKEQLVWSGIGMAESISNVKPINLKLQDNHLNIALPAAPLKGPAELWLFAYEKHRVFTITGAAGEDPYDVNYAHGVLHLQPLAPWSGRALSMALPLDGFPKGAYGYAIIAQDKATREVLAAGKVEKAP